MLLNLPYAVAGVTFLGKLIILYPFAHVYKALIIPLIYGFIAVICV